MNWVLLLFLGMRVLPGHIVFIDNPDKGIINGVYIGSGMRCCRGRGLVPGFSGLLPEGPRGSGGNGVRRRALWLVAALLQLHLVLSLAAIGYAASGSNATGLRGLGYAFAVILTMIGGIAYALGRSDIAKSSWAWAVTVAVIVAWVSGYAAGAGAGGAGGGAEVFCPPAGFYKYIPVSVVVAAPGRSVSASIDWGDNTSSTCTGQGYCVASHSYGEDGEYTIRVTGQVSAECRVTIRSLGSELDAAFSELRASCGWSPSSWPGCIMTYAAKAVGKAFALLSDAVVWLLAHTGAGGVFEKVGLMLVTVPETAPPLLDTHSYAVFLLGYAVIGLALWKAFWEFEKGLSWLDALRDVAYVLLALSLAQPLYTWAARLVNSISIAMAQPGVLMAWMSMLLGFTALAAALPVGGAGGLAATGALGFAGFVLIALLKYLLLEALYLLIPLIAVLWLFPGTRHVARSMTNVIVALMAWNLVLAAMAGLSARALANPANASPLEVIGYGVALPLAMLATGPMIAGLIGAPLPGAGLFAGIYGRLGALAATRLGLAARPQAMMLAAPGQVVGHTEYLRPPIHPTPAGMGVAPGGAWQPVVGSGTPMAISVPTPSPTPLAAKTEWLRPHEGPGRMLAGPGAAGARPVEGGVELRGPEAARSIAASMAEETARDMGAEPEKRPAIEEIPPATQRIKQAAKEAITKPVKTVTEPVRREVKAIKEAVAEAPGGKAAKAAALGGAVAARLHAYMSNRARQFIREFSIAFEKQTGIKVPAKLKQLHPITWQQIEQRIRTGAQAGAIIGQTIYMKIKKPFTFSNKIGKATAGLEAKFKY